MIRNYYNPFQFLLSIVLIVVTAGCDIEDIAPGVEKLPTVTTSPKIEVASTNVASVDSSPIPTIECPVITQMILPTVAEDYNSRKHYFFDSVGGSDSNTGIEPDQAWKSLDYLNSINFKPGDVVYLKRGSIWTGTLLVWASGKEGHPIIFSSYGDSGPPPEFRNPGNANNLTNAIRVNGDWVIIENIKVQDARLAGVYISNTGDHNVIRNIEATQVGQGISVHGQFNQILGNYIHDLTMVRNTEGGNDDHGAVGVWLFNSDNEVAYNRLINLKAPSFDYGEDGGAVEFYKNVNNSYVHHNYANNTKGFIEIGGGSAQDNVIAYNLIVNSGRALGLHLAGKFGSRISNLRFEHNTIVDTTEEGFHAAILFNGDLPSPETLIIRNNIFYLLNFGKLASNIKDGSEFTHDHNLFYLPGGDLGILTGFGEVEADPGFVNLDCRDFRLSKESPAINSGMDLGYTQDFTGNPVPFGITSDLGAFENQGD